MTSCNFKAPNGANSLLYKDLAAYVGEDSAAQIWNFTKSDQFEREYEPDLDENKEPTFAWVKENLNLRQTVEADVKQQEPPTPPPDKVTIHVDTFGAASKENRMEYQTALAIVQDLYNTAATGVTVDATAFKAEGLKKATANGYTPVELANMFASFPIPSTVKFDEKFAGLIVNTASYQLRTLLFDEVPFLNYDEVSLADATKDLFVPIRDKDGKETGKSFTSEQQTASVDTIIAEVWNLYSKDPNISIGGMLAKGSSVYTKLEAFRDKFKFGINLPNHLTQEKATAQAENIQMVLNSWNDFLPRVLYKLESYGLKPKNRSKLGTFEALENLEVAGEGARGLQDWFDVSFERDPKETASETIKLFLASIRQVEIGTEREPTRIKLSFKDMSVRERILGKDPIKGVKSISIRTQESMDKLKVTVGKQYVTEIDGVKFRVTADRVLTADDINDPSIIANAEEEGIIPEVGNVLLRLEEWRPKQDVVRAKENFLGFAELVDFEDLFQEILEVTNGLPNTLKTFLDALREEGKTFRPVLLEVANKVEAQNEEIQREFVAVMSKQYAEQSILLFTKRRNGMLDMTSINANSGSAINSVIKQWQENQKHSPIITRDNLGNLVINKDVALGLQAGLDNIIDAYNSEVLPDMEEEIKPFVKTLLSANGIIIPDEGIDYLMENMTRLTKNTSIAGGVKEQFWFTDDGQPMGMFSALIHALTNQLDENLSDAEEVAYLANNNPLYTTGSTGEGTSLRILAKMAYKFSPKTAAGVHQNSEGKSIYAYVMNTHLSTTFNNIKNDAAYRAKLASTHMGKNNWLLARLDDPKQRDLLGLQYVDGLKQAYKRNAKGVVRPSMSTREQLLFAVGNFQRQGNKTSNFVSLTHSDKSTTPLLTGVTKFYTGKEGIAQNVQDAIYKTVLGEFERIRDWYGNHNTANDSYNKGGGMFYFLPELNYDYMRKNFSAEELQMVWLSKGQPNMSTGAVDFKKLVGKVFEQAWLEPEMFRLNTLMKSEGFFENKLVDWSYFRKNAYNANIGTFESSPGVMGFIDLVTKEVISDAVAMERFYDWANKDFLVNYWLVNTALSSLIYGDPALAYKGKSKTDYRQVEETLNEYQKRLAKDIAPGMDLTWEQGPEETYRALTMLDDERIHSYLSHLEKYAGEKINGSDAQEVTTVREHLYVMRSAGQIRESVYQEMIKIIDDGVKNHKEQYYEFYEKKHLDVIMQIMKPVSVSQNFDEVPGTAVINYVKSSSMPLYPPMTKYFQIDELRRKMEGDGTSATHIPRANFISAKKMGAPNGKGAKVFDSNGNVSIPSNIDSYVQTLSRSGFRIQQEVPYEEFKDSILTGSQSNKLFVEGIEDKTFMYNGKEYTGSELKAHKEDIRKKMITIQHQAFIDKTGAVVIGDQLRIHDKEKLLALLEDEAISRSYPPNDIAMLKRIIKVTDADGQTRTELAIPLFFNPSSSRFESLLMSLVKKIGQVYMPGKSYIQAASSGFKFKQKLNFEDLDANQVQGITWLPGYDGSELKTMTKDSPAEVLLPFNFTIKGKDGQDESVNAKDYAKFENEKWTIDYDKIPKELTEHIAFRIPTQKHNSMLPIKVVGFLPANMGDTIVVPAAITKQMGSDFDVDKLYTYRRPYTYNYDTKTFSVTKSDTETLDTLARDYFDIYWTVLTAESMYETVLQPLDKPDLRNEGNRAAADEDEIQNYYSITHQLKDYQLQKDAKVMVGISSLFVVFNSLIEGKQLKAGSLKAVDDGSWEQTGDNGAEAYETTPEFEADGVAFVPEGEDDSTEAFHISEKGNATYYEKDVETRLTADGIHKIFVDPITGAESPFDKSQALLRTRIDSQVTFQSAFLDHAKERIIDKLNINLNTVYAAFGATALASQDGKRMSEKHIILLLRQPAIKELVDKLNRSQDSLSDSFDANIYDTLVYETMIKYLENAGNLGDTGAYLVSSTAKDRNDSGTLEEFIKKRKLAIVDIRDLKVGIEPKQKTAAWYLHQAGMLSAFYKLHQIGRSLGDIQKVLNQDPRGPGKDMTIVMDTIQKRANLIANPIIQNAENLLNSEQGFIHTTELTTAVQAYREVLPYEGFTKSLEEIRELTGRQQLSTEVIKDIVGDFKSYIFSDINLGLSSDVTLDRYRLLYGNNTEENLATRVWKAQQTSNNYFLKRLRPQGGTTPNTPSYVFYLASRASALDDQENTAAFLELLRSKDPETRKLAEDLVRYAYITGGAVGGFTFIKYIPVDYLIALPFAAQLRMENQALVEFGKEADTDFINQWIRHNPAMVRKVPKGFNENVGEKIILPSPVSALSNKDLRPLLDKDGKYPEYLSHWDANETQWLLFKKQYGSANSYKRIDTLGNSYVTEFSANTESQRSIFPENRALITPGESGVKLDTPFIDRTVVNKGDGSWETDATAIAGIHKQVYKGAELTAVLKGSADNKNLNADNRFMLEYLAEVINKTQRTNVLTLEMLDTNNREGTVGKINPITGVIQVFKKDVTPNEIVNTIVHETIHGILLPYVRMPISEQKKLPGVYEALQEVYKSFTEAKLAVMAAAHEAGLSEGRVHELAMIMQGEMNGTIAENETQFANYAYATSNIDEFMSAIFENREFQLFLNSHKAQNRSRTFMSSLIETILDFLKALKKVLGVTVKKDHQLAVALKRTFELIDEVTINEASILRGPGNVATIGNTYFNGLKPSDGIWTVDNEQKALNIYEDIMEEFPYLHVMFGATDDGRFTIQIKSAGVYKVNAANKPSAMNPLDRVHGKIQEQIRNISSSIARNKSNPDVLRQRALLKELRVLNNDVKATQDLEAIKSLADYELDWAKKIHDQFMNHTRPVSVNQIMTAYRLINVWTDILDLIYNGVNSSDIDYDEDFAKIQGLAQNLQTAFSKKIMRQVFKEMSQSEVFDADFNNIEDTDSGTARFLSIDRAKDRVTQEVGVTIQNTHRAYLEKGQSVVRELREFEQEMKDLADKRGQHIASFYEQFFQDGGNFGLVTRYTPDFYKWRSNLRRKLTDTIETIESSQSDPKARAAMIKAAVNKYWRDLEYKANYVDVRLALTELGDRATNPAAVQYVQDITDEYGEEFTEEIISEAQAMYKEYLKDFEDIGLIYDGQVENGFMTQDEADEALAQWDMDNSPISKLGSRKAGSGLHSNFSDKYLLLVPHKDAKGYDGKTSLFDSKFDKIKKDKELKNTYDKIRSKIDEYTGNLPFYLENKFGDSFLPVIKQRLITDISGAVKYVKNIPQNMIDQLTASSYEEFMQSRTTREIPILYMDNPFEFIQRPGDKATADEWKAYEAKKVERSKEYSRNLPRILELFGLMSYHYKYFSEARDAIDLGEEILKKTDADMQNNLRQVEKNGRLVTVQASLKNTLGALEYTKDVLMFKRARALEGKTGEIVTKKDKNVEGKLRDVKAEMIALDKAFDNNELTPEEYLERKRVIDEKLRGFNVAKVYASKVGDVLITWTQLKALSYNPMSAINNLAFGLISSTIHANGGQDYSWKDLKKAFSIMMNATGRSLGLARATGNDSAMHKTAEKILNLMDRMGIMGELIDSEYGTSNISGGKKGIRSVLSPYQMLRTGDYFVKAMNMVAILHHETVTVNGEKKKLWEVLKQDGTVDIQDEAWQSEDPLKQSKWNKLRNKVIAVNKITMGNQDKSSPILAKKSILWRLIGQFRLSWFSEGIANRFEGKRFDIQLNREKKGRYRTYGDLGFMQSISVLSKQLLSALPFTKLDPFQNAQLRDGTEMTDLDRANMRRNLAEIGWFLLMFGAAHMIGAIASGGGDGDDDDKKAQGYRFMANMAIRSYQDVALYSNPAVFDQILGTPAPALGTIKDVINFVKASGRVLFDDEFTTEQWFYKLTKAGFIPQTTLINKFKTMTEKDLSTLSR